MPKRSPKRVPKIDPMRSVGEAVGGVVYYKRSPVGSFQTEGFVMSDEGLAVATALAAEHKPAAKAKPAAKPTSGASLLDEL